MTEKNSHTNQRLPSDISSLAHYKQLIAAGYELIEEPLVRSLIKPREKISHKYTYGHALLYAGSPGMYGAGVLCAKSCMKSGVGLVSIAVEEKYLSIYQTTLPEIICITDWNDEKVFTKKNAIGIGPGWLITEDYEHIAKKILSQKIVPLVADASVLRLLPTTKLYQNSIITPHIGEFEKCFGKCDNDFTRMRLAIQKAKDLNIYIILKGAYTLVATPTGKAYFNKTGNAGMAKAGSGDVLTGLLTGLLAQGYSPLNTCLLGVYLHGLAGDFAAEIHTQYAMTATDIINQMGQAWKKLT